MADKHKITDRLLAIRSSPHVEFSNAMRPIRIYSLRGTGGLPGRDFTRQNRQNPARCKGHHYPYQPSYGVERPSDHA